MPNFPFWVANGSAAASTGSFTCPLPAGIQEYDVLFLFVETDDQAVATPTDWTSMFSGAAAGASRLQIFWRRVGTTTPPDPTISDGGDHQFAWIAAFRGCITTGNPYDVLGGNTAYFATPAVASSITTTVANTLVVIAACCSGLQSLGTVTNANLANITERIDGQTSQGNDGTLMMAHGEKATAGSVGTTSCVIGGSSPSGAIVQFALKNADEIVLPKITAPTLVNSPTVQNQDIILPHIGPTSVVNQIKVGTHIRLSGMPTEVVLEPEPDFRLSTLAAEVAILPTPHARFSSVCAEVVIVPQNPDFRLSGMPVEVARRQSNESVKVIWWD